MSSTRRRTPTDGGFPFPLHVPNTLGKESDYVVLDTQSFQLLDGRWDRFAACKHRELHIRSRKESSGRRSHHPDGSALCWVLVLLDSRNPIYVIALCTGIFGILFLVIAEFRDHTRTRASRLNGVQLRVFSVRVYGWFVLAFLFGVAIAIIPIIVDFLRESTGDLTFTASGITAVASSIITAVGILQSFFGNQELRNRSRYRLIPFVFGSVGLLLMLWAFILLIGFVVYGNPFRLLPSVLPFTNWTEKQSVRILAYLARQCSSDRILYSLAG